MRVLLDTNILVYLYDQGDHERRRRAERVLALPHEFVISTQVLIEFQNVVRRKLGASRARAAGMLALLDYPTVPTDRALVERAAELAGTHELSIFDALILEAAATARCDELWTEDLTHGSTLKAVRIVNPFL